MKSVLLRMKADSSRPEVNISEVPVPQLSAGELLVEMKACGLCGTDIEKLKGEYTAAMPVLGHEASGVVTKVGNGVDGFKEGDRVFPHHHVPCYECYYCKHGAETMCPEYKKSNIDPGGFSEFFRVPYWNVSKGGVLKLPHDLSFEVATFVEPVACCVRALNKLGVGAGTSVMVVGAGPVGISLALLSKYRQGTVIVSDVRESRLSFAEKSGAKHVINAGREDVPQAVKKLTGGRGADVAIVAAGTQQAILQGVKSVRNGGTVCLFGIPIAGTVLDYDLSKVYGAGLSVVCSYGATEPDTAEAMKQVSEHAVDFGALVTHRFSLEEFDAAVRTATARNSMKVVVTP